MFIGKALAHLVLLQLVPREHDELLRPEIAEDELDELLAERARPAGDEDRLLRPGHGACPSRRASAPPESTLVRG